MKHCFWQFIAQYLGLLNNIISTVLSTNLHCLSAPEDLGLECFPKFFLRQSFTKCPWHTGLINASQLNVGGGQVWKFINQTFRQYMVLQIFVKVDDQLSEKKKQKNNLNETNVQIFTNTKFQESKCVLKALIWTCFQVTFVTFLFHLPQNPDPELVSIELVPSCIAACTTIKAPSSPGCEHGVHVPSVEFRVIRKE